MPRKNPRIRFRTVKKEPTRCPHCSGTHFEYMLQMIEGSDLYGRKICLRCKVQFRWKVESKKYVKELKKRARNDPVWDDIDYNRMMS